MLFREQFYARWQCAIFSREQFVFQVPYKGISFIPSVFTLVLCNTVKSPLHGFTSIDELKNPDIVFRQSKTLVEVQVEISVIPGKKVVVHGITGNYLHNC